MTRPWFAGPQFILTDDLAATYRREQFRFPRTRNRRIRKKWAKRPENFWMVPDKPEQGPFLLDGIIYCGPKAYSKVLHEVYKWAESSTPRISAPSSNPTVTGASCWSA